MIILLGIAGSGKTTQGKLIARWLGCEWLSVGQILRDNMKGQAAQKMGAGELLDNQHIISVLEPKIQLLLKDKMDFVLDGAPRQMGQAEWLAKKIQASEIKLTAIIHLEADPEIVMERLLKRGRADDTKASIEKRFEEFNRHIVPILNYFQQQGMKVHNIDGNLAVEEVAEEIKKIIKK